MHKPIPELTAEKLSELWGYILRGRPGECWLWAGRKNDSGYAVIPIPPHGDIRVSRIMIYITTGIDPGPLFAIHKCEKIKGSLAPLCVNPDHLKAGTQKQNMAYRYGEERPDNLKGEKHGMARVSNAQVEEIRERRSKGERLKTLAAEFGIGTSMISHITTGRNRKTQGGAITKIHVGGYKVTPEMIQEILILRDTGLSQQKISDHFQGFITQSMVSKILAKYA